MLDFSKDPLKKGAFFIKIRQLFKISSKLGSAGSQILRPFLRDSNHHADCETVGMVIVMTMIFQAAVHHCSSSDPYPLRENGVVIYAFHL